MKKKFTDKLIEAALERAARTAIDNALYVGQVVLEKAVTRTRKALQNYRAEKANKKKDDKEQNDK